MDLIEFADGLKDDVVKHPGGVVLVVQMSAVELKEDSFWHVLLLKRQRSIQGLQFRFLEDPAVCVHVLVTTGSVLIAIQPSTVTRIVLLHITTRKGAE